MGLCQEGIHSVRRVLFLLSVLIAAVAACAGGRVRLGNEILIEKHLDLLRGKRVGIVCNQTSRLPNGTFLVDTLLRLGIKVTTLFAPEHGFRGTVAAGGTVSNDTDQVSGLPIVSLYGGTRKPTPPALEHVDVLVFDIQDAGARFYTFASTMAYVMEAAAGSAKAFIVCDRPNPVNGTMIEGPCLDLRLISFVGLFPIPVRHGLTLGELAKMIVGEGYINPSTVDLTVVPMEGWKRSMWFDETGLPWIPPSPNMKTVKTATVYPGTCCFEATNVSEGRGTPRPFEYIGAPKLDAKRLIARLDSFHLPGVRFRPIDFTPHSDSVSGPNVKFSDRLCHGVFVDVTNRSLFQPVLTGVLMLCALHDLYPRTFGLKEGLLNHLIGDEAVAKIVLKGGAGTNILKIFDHDLHEFGVNRVKYLIY
jgi:uncharacterized protein YbbC (DUF1343 family)